ncbi:MAG: carbohydrate kinase family protein [Candidatus Thermoplasmatota archaeon]|nr:carbohydrate kinase family protein [Candidatus Thermoplasmatota archaeon]
MFLDFYREELAKDLETKKMLVLHDANIDLLHVIDEGSLLRSLESYKKCYRSTGGLEKAVLRILELASTTGGEIMIDDMREDFNNFKPFLQKNSKRIIFTLGGNAGNTSIALSRLGAMAWISTAIRDDKYGRWIRAYLRENGVMTDLLKVLDGSREEAMTFGIEIPQRDRGFLNDSSDIRDFRVADTTQEFDGVLMLGLHKLKSGFDRALEFVKTVHGKVISDGGDYFSLSAGNVELLFEIFRNTDLCCMNETELAFCLSALGINSKSERDALSIFESAEKLRNALDLNVLNVHTELFSFDLSKDRLLVLPTLEPRRISVKTGLGDAYVAGKSFGFLQSERQGLALGNANAMVKLEKGDFPTREEIRKRSKTIKIKERGREEVESLIKELGAETVEIKI